MNCTGFVAHAYAAVGGDVNRIAQNNNHSPWAGGPGGGGYINAWRWYGYARDLGCKMYEFRTVQDMLNSGYAQKGDIIFFKTDGSIDCHIGFFWGDNPHDNKMWHQILPGNLIGPCFNNANKGEVRQSVVLIK
jgi:cell wall-associated NlpC family hydrolase